MNSNVINIFENSVPHGIARTIWNRLQRVRKQMRTPPAWAIKEARERRAVKRRHRFVVNKIRAKRAEFNRGRRRHEQVTMKPKRIVDAIKAGKLNVEENALFA